MRIAALVKQIPAFEEMGLGADGRLVRTGVDLEMNAYCRRAVAAAVELVAEHGGSVTVVTMGPPCAQDVLREAIAWATARSVAMEGVHLCDPELAGSDTLATARALAAAIERTGPYDLVLVGRSSVDADTGQVGPQVAELLDLPFATGVRELAVDPRTARANVRCEHDDGWMRAVVALPAVLSTAERLTEPCKVSADGREAVSAGAVSTLTAAELGPGPWGVDASPTVVGTTRSHTVVRDQRIVSGPPEAAVTVAVEILRARGALAGADSEPGVRTVPGAGAAGGAMVGVIVEPDRTHLTRELLGAAAELADRLGGAVTAIGPALPEAALLGSWGADVGVVLAGSEVEEDLARGIAAWVAATDPVVVLAPSTAWGREVAARVAARSGAGLVGDAIEIALGDDDRLIAWKPAFGGQLVAAITCTSPLQMATVRAGALPRLRPRTHAATVRAADVAALSRVTGITRERDDDIDVLADAPVVIGVGAGVGPDEHRLLRPLTAALRAEVAATRKVTDRGWLPRARQIGITGRSIAPRLYVAIGLSGKFNHAVGFCRAGTVVAINTDPCAPVFGCADVGIVGDWRAVVGPLTAALEAPL